MTGKVIDIAAWRAGKRHSGHIELPPTWLFDLRVFLGVDGHEGTIVERGDWFAHLSSGDELRKFAEALEGLAWALRQQAEGEEASEHGEVLATALVFAGGNVRARVNAEKFETEEQLAWLDRQFDAAKVAARDAAKDTLSA